MMPSAPDGMTGAGTSTASDATAALPSSFKDKLKLVSHDFHPPPAIVPCKYAFINSKHDTDN